MATVVAGVPAFVTAAMNPEDFLMNDGHHTPRAPYRREFLAAGLGAFLVAAVPFARRDRRRVVRRTLPVMATMADFTVVHTDAVYAQSAIDAAMAELARVERLMTRFQSTSDIGRANASAALAPVMISHETHAVIEEALRWASASDGAFDPGVGRVVELWDVAHRHEPPAAPDVRRLEGRRFYRHIESGTEKGMPAVFFTSPEVHLDLGGIACGYAVDLAIDSLRRWGIRDALVNVSGDIFALGHAPDGSPWRIGIRSPVDARAVIAEVEITDRAIATSGDYEQFFMYRGVRYHHLMDPELAAPRRSRVHTVTVVADRCSDADAASTAVFGMAPAAARLLLSARSPGAWVVSEA
jgi:thiamine biosynthesis lipoprotein